MDTRTTREMTRGDPRPPPLATKSRTLTVRSVRESFPLNGTLEVEGSVGINGSVEMSELAKQQIVPDNSAQAEEGPEVPTHALAVRVPEGPTAATVETGAEGSEGAEGAEGAEASTAEKEKKKTAAERLGEEGYSVRHMPAQNKIAPIRAPTTGKGSTPGP